MFTYTYVYKNILIPSLPNIKHLIHIPPPHMLKLCYSSESMPNMSDDTSTSSGQTLPNGRMGWQIDIRIWFFGQLCYLHSFLVVCNSDLYGLEESICMINFKSSHVFW